MASARARCYERSGVATTTTGANVAGKHERDCDFCRAQHIHVNIATTNASSTTTAAAATRIAAASGAGSRHRTDRRRSLVTRRRIPAINNKKKRRKRMFPSHFFCFIIYKSLWQAFEQWPDDGGVRSKRVHDSDGGGARHIVAAGQRQSIQPCQCRQLERALQLLNQLIR
jgi:hypothetical protein